MASRIFIAQTALNDLRPLAWQGVQAVSCYNQLTRILFTKLSPQHAALLAEPLMDDASRTIDWYALNDANNPEIPVQKLSELPHANQEFLREQLLALGRDVYSLAQNLKNSQDSNSVTAGTLLEMAISFPSEDYLYAIGLQPVITCWGYVSHKAEATPELITRVRTAPNTLNNLAAAAPFASSFENFSASTGQFEDVNASTQGLMSQGDSQGAGQEVEQNPNQNPNPNLNQKIIYHEHRASSSPIAWAILAFLVGAILCGLLLFYFKPAWNNFSFAGWFTQPKALVNATNSTSSENDPNAISETREEILRGQGKEEVLRKDLDRLRREYELRLLNCKHSEPIPFAEANPLPEKPVPPSKPEAPPVPELNIPKPAPEPAPKPMPKPIPEPAPPAPPVPPAEQTPPAPKPKPQPDHLSIPENPENLEFLEGCWEAEIASNTPGRYNTTPQRLVYCFDKKGKGKGALTERRNGKEICVGPAEGELRGGSLAIKDKKPFNVGAGTCITEVITCTNADSGVAMCSSHFEDGGRSKLVFRRK